MTRTPRKNTPKQKALQALNKKVARSSTALTAAAVSKELNAFRRSRGPSSGLDEHYLLMTSLTPRMLLEELGALDAPQLRTWYHRHPKKRNLRHANVGPLVSWRQPNYKHIQGLRRNASYINAMLAKASKPPQKRNSNSNWNENSNDDWDEVDGNAPPFSAAKTRRDDRWLALYMKLHALRAPAKPLRAPDGPLFRGVMLTDDQLKQLMSTKTWEDKGYMSFTRDHQHAMAFGSRKTRWQGRNFVMFRLPLRDVARGTPWIWFVGTKEQKMWMQTDDPGAVPFMGWDVQGEPGESEVTLPPGTLHAHGTPRRIPSGAFSNFDFGAPHTAHVVDVTYAPSPEFAFKPRRKGTREENTDTLWNVFGNVTRQGTTRRRPDNNNNARNTSKRGRTT